MYRSKGSIEKLIVKNSLQLNEREILRYSTATVVARSAKSNSNMKQGATISVLFGPQGAITPETLLDLRRTLQETNQLSFLSDTIAELPEIWTKLTQSCPGMDKVNGRKKLEKVADFFVNGKTAPSDIVSEDCQKNNVTITPLSVVYQIVEYWKLSNRKEGSEYGLPDFPTNIANVQGFCLGILVAISVSCSKSEAEFGRLASTAVRLSLLLAAWVDLDAHQQDDSACAIAVRCKSAINAQHFDQILSRYPEVRDVEVVNCRASLTQIGIRFLCLRQYYFHSHITPVDIETFHG